MKPDYQTLFNTNVQKVKAGTNGQFTGLCPFHNDKNRSLSWNESGLWNCFAGCGSGNAYQFAEYGEGAAFEGYFETQSPLPIAERTDKGHAALYAYVS